MTLVLILTIAPTKLLYDFNVQGSFVLLFVFLYLFGLLGMFFGLLLAVISSSLSIATAILMAAGHVFIILAGNES